jgi:hypothetical protein
MSLGDKVTKLITAITPHKQVISIGIGAAIGVPFALQGLQSATQSPDVLEILKVAGIASCPLLAYGITYTTLGIAEFFTQKEKQLETSLDDLIEAQPLPDQPRKWNVPLWSGITLGLGHLVGKTYTKVSGLHHWTPDNDAGFTRAVVEQTLPTSILLSCGAYAAIKNMNTNPVVDRLGSLSVLASGAAYYAICESNNEYQFAAALLSPAIGFLAYAALACISRPPSTAQLRSAMRFSLTDEETKKDILGADANFVYLFDDLSAGKYDELFTKCSELIEHDTPDRHPLVRLGLDLQLTYERWENRLQLLFSPKNPQFDITRSAIELIDDNKAKAQAHLMRAVTKSERYRHPLRNESLVLYAMFTGTWKSCLQKILADPTVTFEPIGPSDNEVATIENSTFLSNTFAIKRTRERSSLLDEQSVASQLDTTLSSPNRHVAQSLYIDEQDPVMVMRYAQGTTLDQSTSSQDFIHAAGYLVPCLTRCDQNSIPPGSTYGTR